MTPEIKWRALVLALIFLWLACIFVALTASAADPCAPGSYDRARYPYDPAAQRALLPLYLPYTHVTPDSKEGLQVEHIVSLEEAHYAGLCRRGHRARAAFAKDVRNQTLALPGVNRDKSSKTIAEWRPPSRVNWKWYARRVRMVAREWDLDLGPGARAAIRAILESQ